MGTLSSLLGNFAKLALVLLIIALLPGLPPHVDFKEYRITPASPLEGSLALNSALNNAERLLEGSVHGPEDLKVYDGHLYTTVHGGHVARLNGDKLEHVVKFGQPCEGFHEEDKCGRPLGLEFDKNGQLYVADAYYGLFKVNITTGQSEQLVSVHDSIEGKRPMMPNGVAVAADGSVYWTDSSTSHHLYDGLFTVLANGNGRLLKYDPATKSSSVLWDQLHFPNGVALSHDGSYLVICETLTSRLLKYYLKGPKAGQSEVLLDGLPGMPDNVHRDPSGQFVVSLVLPRGPLDVPTALGPLPLVRKLAARLLLGLQSTVALARDIYPTELLSKATHMIGHFESIPPLLKRATVLYVSEGGKVTRSLYATDGLEGVSSCLEFGGYYYLGSPFNTFLARVKAS